MAISVALTAADGIETTGQFIAQSDGINLFIAVTNSSASPVTIVGVAVSVSPPFASVLVGQPQLPMGGVSIPGSSTVTLAQPVAVSGLRPQSFGQTATSPAPPSFTATVTVSDGSAAASPPVTLAVSASLGGPVLGGQSQNAMGYGNSQLLPGSLVNYQYYNPNTTGTVRMDGYQSGNYIFPGVALGLF